ncbi:hypothetical protein BGW36DRAFT_44550 [Talaromyces proteolyticus]|uniref:Uncharacterized protein n=1 Tax=Talaromyces proteolyticus TaxID=1131652 RepID=A0AAD4PUL6_9EURO|nr:uncharacterized protein BGW36DRAFT_44550 [Talaromyces proteolyticus]KAH8692320.1 hypothetical protein BGW36DRAFT_44550 [Talaromyces proteolyticus]
MYYSSFSLISPHQLYAPEALASLYDGTVLWWQHHLRRCLFRIDNDLALEGVKRIFYHHWKNRSPSAKRPLLRGVGRALHFALLTILWSNYLGNPVTQMPSGLHHGEHTKDYSSGWKRRGSAQPRAPRKLGRSIIRLPTLLFDYFFFSRIS